MRLNKYVAHTGLCSRRKAGDLVKAGKIKVNGKVEINPAIEVTVGEDTVEHGGKVIKVITKKVYLLLNKPKNVITSMDDDRGRKTVWDVVKEKVKVKIKPVGRLDRNTTGLLLLTNDGDLAKKLSHPSHEIEKVYHVFLDKEVTNEDIRKIAEGLTLEDGFVPVDSVSHVKGKSKKEVGIELHIGRNRIVRRIFEHLGYKVDRLDRVYYAGLTKKDLTRGRYRHLTEQEVIMLKHFKETLNISFLDRKPKSSTFSFFRFHPDSSVVLIYYFLYHCQTNSGTVIFIAGV